MEQIKDIEVRINNILQELKNILDEILQFRKDSPQNKQLTAQIIENFLSELYRHFKVKSKEAGDNLLAGVSLLRIKK
ncbi:MAG: hypothetical protein ACOWWO_11065 [Peptococcaceae bacterium]